MSTEVEMSTLESVLPVFKALADESRLRLLGVLVQREANVDELATLLSLRPPTVSHHLAKLREIGLLRVRVEGTSHLYSLDVEALRDLRRDLLAPESVASFAPPDERTWERKVLHDFFEGERLREIPASRKKREVVLRWLAERFERDRRYAEKEVNAVLACHHPDFATLRRELIADDPGLMTRENGIYWRL
jgi:DNA-binding transcriptional ArsR family regulator